MHQADITVNGWTGSGYIILDPETGAGAYKISGGMNGGALDFGCGVASGALSYFFGIAYGVQHLLELSGNDSQKAKIAEIVLGAAVNLFGNSAEFRADVMNMLWDDLDFYLGKLIMGLLIGALLTRAVGFIAVPSSVALQIFSTLGYLLGIIEGKPQSQACGSA
ncbi:MAG: hypothetical protein AB1717_02725 [Pseudomonadota bacterium]